MAVSPFHGLFSALHQDGKGKKVFPDGHMQDAPIPQPAAGGAQQRQQQAQTGKVAVDIYEQDDYYIVRAPIAGVRLSDLDIEVNENVLTIRGTRRQPDDVEPGQYFLQECFWGPFARSVTLPMAIDPRKVRATFNKECILKILIPKEEKVKVVRISEA